MMGTGVADKIERFGRAFEAGVGLRIAKLERTRQALGLSWQSLARQLNDCKCDLEQLKLQTISAYSHREDARVSGVDAWVQSARILEKHLLENLYVLETSVLDVRARIDALNKKISVCEKKREEMAARVRACRRARMDSRQEAERSEYFVMLRKYQDVDSRREDLKRPSGEKA